MTDSKNPRGAKVQAAFNLAADSYDDPSQAWGVTAVGTLDVARLQPGEVVLDVCCGSGSTSLPAAEAVSPGGRVTGVDLSDGMLALARAKQAERGIANVEFRRADMTELPYPPESFDAVICQLGLHFVQDTGAQVSRLWRLVKPGGRVVFATFLGRPNEQAGPIFAEAMKAEREDMAPVRPGGGTNDIDSMRQLMLDAGTSDPVITVSENMIPLRDPEDYWTRMLGGGQRGRIEEIGPEAAARVHDRVVSQLRDDNVTELSWNIIYSVAHKN